MIYISKNDYDKSYPYTLEGSWGGKIYCSEEELRKLCKELNEKFSKNT